MPEIKTSNTPMTQHRMLTTDDEEEEIKDGYES